MKKGALVQIQSNKTIGILVEDVDKDHHTALALYMTREHPRPMLVKLQIENGLLYFTSDRGLFYNQSSGQYKEEMVQIERMVMFT